MTVMMQFAFTVKVDGHVFICEKFAAPEVTPIEMLVSEAVPVLVTMTCCVGAVEPTFILLKLRLAEDKVTSGPVTPVPERLTV